MRLGAQRVGNVGENRFGQSLGLRASIERIIRKRERFLRSPTPIIGDGFGVENFLQLAVRFCRVIADEFDDSRAVNQLKTPIRQSLAPLNNANVTTIGAMPTDYHNRRCFVAAPEKNARTQLWRPPENVWCPGAFARRPRRKVAPTRCWRRRTKRGLQGISAGAFSVCIIRGIERDLTAGAGLAPSSNQRTFKNWKRAQAPLARLYRTPISNSSVS